MESAEKRKDFDDEEELKDGESLETVDEDIVFRRPKSAPHHSSQPIYESLASALSKEDRLNANINKSDPYAIAQADIPMVETRKRPTSKSIEQILYPRRFGRTYQSSEGMKI